MSSPLADEVKRAARALGFDLVGITTATPPDHAAAFQRWLADDFHGKLGYLARNAAKRVDPQAVLPGARSIVVVGMNYWTRDHQDIRGEAVRDPSTSPAPKAFGASSAQDDTAGGARPAENGSARGDPPQEGCHPERSRGISSESVTGRVTRYAWGTADYHDLIGKKLEQLAAFVRGLPTPNTPAPSFVPTRHGTTEGKPRHSNTRALWYVDTGPILERDLAQRAGIGFIGKHTNLINRGLGNWIFLGAIVTTLELKTDPPATRTYCGTCTRCLTACPTRAIVAPYRLDARRCISYLTIELKGSIPAEFRPLIGDRVFGCDDCVEVCPWNRFARQSPVAAFRRRPQPLLREFLGWTDAQFREFFRGAPVLRLKRGRFLRNVCVALGNVGGPADLPALANAARDADPLVREHAAWAIDRIWERATARD